MIFFISHVQNKGSSLYILDLDMKTIIYTFHLHININLKTSSKWLPDQKRRIKRSSTTLLANARDNVIGIQCHCDWKSIIVAEKVLLKNPAKWQLLKKFRSYLTLPKF